MLDILPSPDHVAAYTISGTLTGEDIERIIADIEAKLARHERIGVLVDLTAFKDLTLEAGAKDLRYGLGKMLQLRRFPREAVITDKEWVRTLVRIADPLVPFVEIRTFEPGTLTEAMNWVSEVGA
jgi:SpoIIAA-like